MEDQDYVMKLEALCLALQYQTQKKRKSKRRWSIKKNAISMISYGAVDLAYHKGKISMKWHLPYYSSAPCSLTLRPNKIVYNWGSRDHILVFNPDHFNDMAESLVSEHAFLEREFSRYATIKLYLTPYLEWKERTIQHNKTFIDCFPE